jgi:hypothetical protein
MTWIDTRGEDHSLLELQELLKLKGFLIGHWVWPLYPVSILNCNEFLIT